MKENKNQKKNVIEKFFFRYFNFKTLKRKFVVPIVTIFIMLFVFFLGVFFSFQKSELKKDLAKNIEIQGSLLGKFLVDPLWNYLTDQVDTIAQSSFKEEKISYIKVWSTDKNNNSKVESFFYRDETDGTVKKAESTFAFKSDEELIIKSIPIERVHDDGKTGVIGKVELGFTLKYLKAAIFKSFLALSSFGVLLIFALITVLYFVSNIIVRPIQNLSHFASDISKSGDWNKKFETDFSFKDEVGDLAIAFNNMIDFLKKSYNDLKDLNSNLENIVSQRTEQLDTELKKVNNLLNNMQQAVFCIDNKQNIVAPVSRITSSVFGKEVLGKNIFDVLYKDLQKNTETYSTLYSSLLNVFGSGPLQWDLSEDGLIRKINYNKSNDERNLIVKYTPLYNTLDEVDKIMYVIEDVTEIEKLERKVAEDKIASEHRINLLQQLAGIDQNDLVDIFKNAYTLIGKIEESINQFDENFNEQMPIVKRNLHTLKGNLRTYGFVLASQSVHEVECYLLDNEMKKNTHTTADQYHKLQKGSLQNGIRQILSCISEYSEMAKAIFGIENEYKSNKMAIVYFDLLEFEKYLIKKEKLMNSNFSLAINDKMGPSFVKLKFDSVLSDYFRKWENVFTELGEKVVAEKLNILLEDMSKNTNEWLNQIKLDQFNKNYDEFRQAVLQMFFSSANFGLYNFGHADIVPLIIDFMKLNLLMKGEKLDYAKIQRLLYKINFKTSEYKFYYLTEITGIVMDEFKNSNQLVLEEYFYKSWSYLTFYISLNLANSMSEEKALSFIDKVDQLSNGHNNENVVSDEAMKFLDRMDSSKNLITSIFAASIKNKIRPFEFLKMSVDMFAYFKLDFTKRDTLSILFGIEPMTKSHWNWPECYGLIREKGFFELNQYRNDNMFSKFISLFIQQLKNKEMSPTTFLIDMMQLFNTFINGAEKSDITKNTLNVSLVTFHNLKDYVLGYTPNLKDTVGQEKLKSLFYQLLHLPVKSSLEKYKTMIKEVSSKCNKFVDFEIIGAEITLSRERLNILQDAIVHILRNSISHGIEYSEIREKCNKPFKGKIQIMCLEEMGNNVIKISDDGAGINPNVLKQKLIEKKLIAETELSKMSDQEIINLIMLPGFSTAEKVNDISGRGIGMDVVKTNLESIGGKVEVVSEVGKGTTMILTIPAFENNEDEKEDELFHLAS